MWNGARGGVIRKVPGPNRTVRTGHRAVPGSAGCDDGAGNGVGRLLRVAVGEQSRELPEIAMAGTDHVGLGRVSGIPTSPARVQCSDPVQAATPCLRRRPAISQPESAVSRSHPLAGSGTGAIGLVIRVA